MTIQTSIDEAVLRKLAAEGHGPTSIANEIGCSRTLIYRRATKLGIEIDGNRKPIPDTCRRQVQSMKLVEAVDYLLEVIANLCPAQDDTLLVEVGRYGFTTSEAQVLLTLFSAQFVSKQKAFDSVYGMRSDAEVPADVIVSVWLCKIRKKLKLLNWSVAIETVWGKGYCGVRKDGFQFPWERA